MVTTVSDGDGLHVGKKGYSLKETKEDSRRTPCFLALTRSGLTDIKKTMGNRREGRNQEFVLFTLNIRCSKNAQYH